MKEVDIAATHYYGVPSPDTTYHSTEILDSIFTHSIVDAGLNGSSQVTAGIDLLSQWFSVIISCLAPVIEDNDTKLFVESLSWTINYSDLVLEQQIGTGPNFILVKSITWINRSIWNCLQRNIQKCNCCNQTNCKTNYNTRRYQRFCTRMWIDGFFETSS